MKFQKYKVVPLQELGETVVQCEERNADLWGLYGIDKHDNAYAVGDFSRKSNAEFIKDALEAS